MLVTWKRGTRDKRPRAALPVLRDMSNLYAVGELKTQLLVFECYIDNKGAGLSKPTSKIVEGKAHPLVRSSGEKLET